KKHQAHADADGAVGHVEGGKTDRVVGAAGVDVKVKEVDDVVDADAVEEISQNAADDQAERDLAGEGAGIEMAAAEEQDDERAERHHGEQSVVPAEQAPGRAGIA